MCTGDLLERMYPDEDPVQNVQRRDHLVDLYLNMPDKVGKMLFAAHVLCAFWLVSNKVYTSNFFVLAGCRYHTWYDSIEGLKLA
jgi:hypothetical protein